MTIIKNKLLNTNEYLFDSNLSLKAKGLLSMLININPNINSIVDTIKKQTKNGQESIKTTIDELIKNNYLKKIKTRDTKGYFVYNYEVYDKKFSNEKNIER